ncbi:MAG: hypothetical protein KW802_01575 [Candidatus Doudnabacteria bacterium]|nr:hypothetical protein [Candidatus Doudnabacteria bacterium]
MDTIQQVINRISQVSSVLIIGNTNGDSLAASLALRAFIKKLEKEVVLLVPQEVPSQFNFLPQIGEIKNRVDLIKSFVIDISTKKSEVSELSYKKEPEKLSIFLKPNKGEFTAADVTFRSSNFPYELLLLVGISSPEQLGEFYSRNTELFFNVPIANIDFRASNENYAQYNLVNLAATSCSEIVLDLINKFEASLIDEDIATQLLAGIIAETNSFQHVRTTPQTFLKASQLVSLGAQQEKIIQNLYKTKGLGLLKLWGRVLARLKQDAEIPLAYSAVNQNDLVRSGATDTDAESIIKEMSSQLGFAKIFLFIKENSPTDSEVYVQSFLPLNLAAIFSSYSPTHLAPQIIKFQVHMPVIEAEQRLVEILRTHLQQIKPTN